MTRYFARVQDAVLSSGSEPVLIVGGGLAGLMTAWTLRTEGIASRIVHDPRRPAASIAAGGLATPVRGKNLSLDRDFISRAWRCRRIYHELEEVLGIHVLSSRQVLRLFTSADERELWYRRREDLDFRKVAEVEVSPERVPSGIESAHGGFLIQESFQVDVPLLREALMGLFEGSASLEEASFDMNDCEVEPDHIVWRGKTYRSLVLAQGWYAQDNPFTKYLDWKPARGIVLRLEIDHPTLLAPDYVLNFGGTWLAPFGGSYLAGSTYSWDDLEGPPRKEEILEIETNLSQFVRVPFEIAESREGIRPCLASREPLAERIATGPIWAVNGLGSSGVALAPILAGRIVSEISSVPVR